MLTVEMAVLLLQHLTLLLFFLGAASEGCGPNQYPHIHQGREICCNYCAAGEEIIKECTTSNTASTCAKCKTGYYNRANSRMDCLECRVCNKNAGSIEVKPCTISETAECRCPTGSTPLNSRSTACKCEKGNEIVNNTCQPCAPGYFSPKDNTACRPWTNCSARGEKELKPGSKMWDVTCSKPQSTISTENKPREVTPTTLQPVKVQTNGQVHPKQNSTPVTGRPVLDTSSHGGTISFILISVSLLMTSAGIILAMVVQIKKKKGNEGFNRGQRCRVPVQEANPSPDSSLAKMCPA